MDLFVLDTPLQLLNALEARYHFGNRPSVLVLLHWPAWPKTVFERLLNEMEWQEITWISMDIERPAQRYLLIGPIVSDRLNEYRWVYRQYIRRRCLDTALARFGQVDRLVVGNLFNQYMQHVAIRVHYSELVAVDDGTDTLRVATLRQKVVDIPKESPPIGLIQSIKQLVNRRYVDWDARQPQTVTFFTAYDLAVSTKDRLIKNDYRWLRKHVNGFNSNGQVYFLGQPLVEDGYLEESTYLEYLNKIVGYFDKKPVLYIPHKRESNRTVMLVEHKVGLATRSFGGPIEVILALDNECPDVLASFFCSALENCSILFGSSLMIIAFYLPPQALLYDDSPSESIYEYFRRRQNKFFRVVEV